MVATPCFGARPMWIGGTANGSAGMIQPVLLPLSSYKFHTCKRNTCRQRHHCRLCPWAWSVDPAFPWEDLWASEPDKRLGAGGTGGAFLCPSSGFEASASFGSEAAGSTDSSSSWLSSDSADSDSDTSVTPLFAPESRARDRATGVKTTEVSPWRVFFFQPVLCRRQTPRRHGDDHGQSCASHGFALSGPCLFPCGRHLFWSCGRTSPSSPSSRPSPGRMMT